MTRLRFRSKAARVTGGAAVKAAVTAAACTIAAGCAITPPVTKAAPQCDFSMHPLRIEEPPMKHFGPTSISYETMIEAAAPAPDDAVLYMSGGSLNGAFGAGLLDQWSKNAGGLPRFEAVTGISTGAILATWAFLGKPQVLAEAYAIDKESQLLDPYVTLKDGELTNWSYLTILRKGAMADLGPLRKTLRTYVTHDLLEEVHRNAEGRALMVGVVDMDAGVTLALDMLDMARKYHLAAEANDAAKMNLYRDCYIDAIVASSSAPLAARPVFIDNRMYMDGGIGFGLFAASLRDAVGLAPTETDEGDKDAPAPPGQPPAVYMIVNGTQDVEVRCGKREPAFCGDGEPFKQFDGAHKDWSFTDVAFRTKGLLVNQVFRFSVADIVSRYELAYPEKETRRLHYARMDRRDAAQHDFQGKTCSAWKQDDVAEGNPVQFFPKYMACLIDYGRARANALRWHDPARRTNDVPL